MKKYLICLLTIFTLTFVVGFNVNANDASDSTVEDLNALVTSYYNDGVYTKNTEIYLSDVAVNELVQNSGFHAGASDLVRVTIYNGNTLTMTIPGNDTYESNYGTDEEGNLTHWGKGEEPKVAVKKPTSAENAGLWRNWEEDGMEGYYWTLKDIVAISSHNWECADGVYTSSNSEVVEWFKAVVAPCYIGFAEETKNYITLSSVSIEKVEETLVLSLYADGTDAAKLTSDSNLFAKAVINAGLNYYLTSETVASEKLNGEGTEENPFLINNDADLLYFHNSVDEGNNYEGLFVKLNANINVSGYDNFMIGYYIASDNFRAFSGHFDGGNHLISGLNINNTETTNYGTGLIACLGFGGSIKNLAVDGTVVGLTKVGAIAGRCSGSVSNCINYADVTGQADVGGLIGYAMSADHIISDCVNNGNVTGTNVSDTQTGGIAGVSAGKVLNCVNNGNVTGVHVVGGIASYIGAESTNNVNYGRIEGNNCVGGIAGIYGYSSHIGKQSYALTNSVNYGEVVGKKSYDTLRNIGGVAGWLYMSVADCNNEGTITVDAGAYYVGGITGNIGGTNAAITNCTNNADIKASKIYAVGGIAGYVKTVSSITNCENSGDIEGQKLLGGVLGHADMAVTISGCENSGDITATSHDIGGILGAAYSAAKGTRVNECSNSGNIKASYQAGGIAGIFYGTNNSVANCENSGSVTVTGSEAAGGIIGRTNSGSKSTTANKVLSCINTGEVSGVNAKWVGGIVGILGSQSTIAGCTNEGSVTGSRIVGGINGSMYSTSIVTNSTNKGNVTAAKDYVGGIAGYIEGTNSKIDGCTNEGIVKSELTTGIVNAGAFIGGGLVDTDDNLKTPNKLTVSNNTNTGRLDVAEGVTGYDVECGGTTAETHASITFSNNIIK